MITKIADHVAKALARLPAESREQPNIIAFVSALARPAQAVEDALWQLLTERGLRAATGVSLDRIGKVVGQPRDGRTDEVYRALLRARIAANRTSGTVNDLISVVSLALGAGVIDVRREGTAAVDVEAREVTVDDAAAQISLDLLLDAKLAGVRLTFQYANNPFADGQQQNFRFDSNGFGFDGGDNGNAGFRAAQSS